MFRVSRQNHTSIKHQHIRTLADIVTPTTSFFASTNTTTPSFISSVQKSCGPNSSKCQYFWWQQSICKRKAKLLKICVVRHWPRHKKVQHPSCALSPPCTKADPLVTCTYTNTYTNTYTYTCTHFHKHIHIHTFTNIYTQKHTHQTYTLSKPTSTHPHMKTPSFVYKDIHTCRHTHTHACF